MKNIILILLCSLAFGISSSYAQKMQESGHLTIISEDGEPFILFLNGMQFNNRATTGVRIEDLPNRFYNVRLEFKNRRISPVVYDNLPIADLEGYHQDITYSVNTQRRGERALMVYAVQPLTPIYVDLNDFEIYGNGDKGRKINASDEFRGRWSGRKDRYRNHNNDKSHHNDREPNHGGKNRDKEEEERCVAMSNANFTAALKSVNDASFDKSRTELVNAIVSTNCVNTDQIIKLMNEFSFDPAKLDFAKRAYAACVDPENYFKVSNALTFSKNKNELNQYIQEQASKDKKKKK